VGDNSKELFLFKWDRYRIAPGTDIDPAQQNDGKTQELPHPRMVSTLLKYINKKLTGLKVLPFFDIKNRMPYDWPSL